MADKSQDAALQGLDAMTAEIGTGGTLELFTGAPPANCAAAETGTKLSIHTLSPTAFQAAVPDTATQVSASADAIGSATVIGAGGTVGYFRFKKSDGTTCVFQGTAGIGQELDFPDPVFTSGGTVSISSFDFKFLL